MSPAAFLPKRLARKLERGDPSALCGTAAVTSRKQRARGNHLDAKQMISAVAAKEASCDFASLELLFDRDPRPMWVFDLQWLGLIAVNSAAVSYFGHPRAELLRQTIAEFVHDQDLGTLLRDIEPRTGRAVTTGRWRIVHADGRLVAVDGEVERFDFRGQPAALVVFRVPRASAGDAACGAFGEEVADLQSRTKTEFLSRLSHELRTPLNAVIGFSELLAMQPGSFDANQSRYLEHILDAGRHLLSLVDDVLDLQRVDERGVPLAPRPLDLASFITSEAAMLVPLLAKQSLTLHNDVPAGLIVSADEKCLRQVLLNLATNAINYNRPRGLVRWTASVVRPGFAVLMISDTGQGIPREQIPRLFQPFDRLGREKSPKGSGLGLLIARGLVEHMGGRLDVESGLGLGTQVLVELPLAEPHSLFGILEEGAEPAASAPAAMPVFDAEQPYRSQSNLMPTMRVLYVEDNRINAMLFEAVLGARADIELRVAETGWEALEIVEGWTPDVLVLDAHLPDIHGIRLLRQMRELESLRTTPAFMCSADAMEEDMRAARAAGFSDYWTKPVDFNKVLGDLRRLSRGAARSPGEAGPVDGAGEPDGTRAAPTGSKDMP
jgi:PAS domain S-box-containing protein